MKSLIILMITLIVAACGANTAGVEPIDAMPVAIDGSPPPLDAFAGLARGEACAPLGEQCQAGLTCRILGHADGVCLPIGTLVESDICESTSQCGMHMACLPAELGRWRCVVICSVPGNVGPTRCREGALCQRYWSDDEGFCQ